MLVKGQCGNSEGGAGEGCLMRRARRDAAAFAFAHASMVDQRHPPIPRGTYLRRRRRPRRTRPAAPVPAPDGSRARRRTPAGRPGLSFPSVRPALSSPPQPAGVRPPRSPTSASATGLPSFRWASGTLRSPSFQSPVPGTPLSSPPPQSPHPSPVPPPPEDSLLHPLGLRIEGWLRDSLSLTQSLMPFTPGAPDQGLPLRCSGEGRSHL